VSQANLGGKDGEEYAGRVPQSTAQLKTGCEVCHPTLNYLSPPRGTSIFTETGVQDQSIARIPLTSGYKFRSYLL